MTATEFDIAAATRTLLVGDTEPSSGRTGVQLYVSDPDGVAAARAAVDGAPATVFTPAEHVDQLVAEFDRSPVVGIDGDIGAFDDLYLDAHTSDNRTQAVEPIAVRIQDYASSPYVSILGTTLVRLDTDDDVEAFLADADTAYETGVFAPFVIHPAVELADSGDIDGSSIRLYVHPGGALTVSPFQSIGSPAARAVPTSPLLAATIGDDPWEARPWLPTYLRAVRALRRIGANGHEGARVSGFGARLDRASSDGATGAAQADALADAHRPILAFTRETAFIAQGAALVTCSLEAGALVEALLTQSDPSGHLSTIDADRPEHRLVAALASTGISFETHGEVVPV